MARLVAYQHEVKLLKYATASLHLCHQEAVTQRQVQVVAGGLVYMSMSLPGQCRLEMLRFLCLIPLARRTSGCRFARWSRAAMHQRWVEGSV